MTWLKENWKVLIVAFLILFVGWMIYDDLFGEGQYTQDEWQRIEDYDIDPYNDIYSP